MAIVTHQSPKQVPVLVIGGFLGAGKTTLLNHILSETHGVRAAVLVNDFGAINIDAKLVVGVEGETVNLANGCVCCSIRDDLVAACMGLLQRPDPPELVIVETSGVSDPIQVANTFLMPELQPVLSLNGILAVVDADQFPSLQGESAELAQVQIKVADMVVLNKLDLVSSEDLANVKARLREMAPGSRILEATRGGVPMKLIMGIGCRTDIAPHPELGPHQPDHTQGHPFSTWHWTSDRPLSLPKLRAVFESLTDTVYRAKGFVYLEELSSYRVVLQMVGKRSSLRDSEPWGDEVPRSEIVVIGARGGLDREELQHLFEGCIGAGDESQSPVLRLSQRLSITSG
jgi:G3E family GTPase